MPGRFAPAVAGIDHARRSPNHNDRVGFDAPDCIVLHYTGMVDAASAIDRLCDPASSVSCHYVVTEAGGILQLVDEHRRAWHAGRSWWRGVTDMNSASIGIEIVNGGHEFGLPPFPDTQIDAVIRLCRDVIERHAIEAARVLAHSDIAPGRKRDPGERFPWARLAAAGVGIWPATSGVSPDAPSLAVGERGQAARELQEGFAQLGFDLSADGVFGSKTEAIVQAFQRRYRADRVDGVADSQTIGRLQSLLALG